MRSSFLDDAKTALLALVIACAGAACADFSRGPAPVDAGGSDVHGDASHALVADLDFETNVYSTLLRNCAGCHADGKEAGMTRLLITGNARSDRAGIMALVDPQTPTDSLLLVIGSGGRMHTGGNQLGQETPEYQAILNWISNLASSM